jgi:squalene-hopene/tetraprenyl-beta-curcumene cyclase
MTRYALSGSIASRFVLPILVSASLAASTPPADDSTVTQLDPRIDDARMTSLPTPQESVLAGVLRTTPPAPVHRIATRAAGVPLAEADFARAREAIRSGLAYLERVQTPRGTFFESVEVTPTDMEPRKRAASLAVTALALKAFVQAGELGSEAARDAARRAVEAALADDAARARVTEGGVGNYVMSAVASGLAAVGDEDARAGALRAVEWLRRNQWDEGEGVGATRDWYGGAGYGNGKRPDLSNTQMMIEAMHDAGVSPEDPAMQRALAFVARTQNRKATNPADWAQSGSGDGGFVYSPANGGESFASEDAGEGRYGEKLATRSLRSYGSMTYAGFKSMLYAGLSPDDPRVQDALSWIERHFTFAENPGLGQQGYYYYLHAMSRALHASRKDTLRDADGRERDWRSELIDAIVSRQREDGSWQNSVPRWEEANADLATVYCVLALEEAIKPRVTAE